MQQPVKPEQIEVVIEKPKKQPVQQLNPVELEFKPTKLQCPNCKETVGVIIMSNYRNKIRCDNRCYWFVVILGLIARNVTANHIKWFIYLIYYYTSLILIFKKVVTEVSYEFGDGASQACCLTCVFGPAAWFLVFCIPTTCCNRNKDAVHRCPLFHCQAEIGKKPYKICGRNSSCHG